MNIQNDKIFLVGNPGLYDILNFDSDTESSFLNKMNLVKRDKNILVVYHSETLLSQDQNKNNIELLISAFNKITNFKNINIIFIETNADNYNSYISKAICKFKDERQERPVVLGNSKNFSAEFNGFFHARISLHGFRSGCKHPRGHHL